MEHKEGMSIADIFIQIKDIQAVMDNVVPLPTCSCCNGCVLYKKVLEI